MTDAISPKLLVLLALSVVVAAVGGWRLLNASDATLDTGFAPATELPIVAPQAPNVSSEISEPIDEVGRNPFSRADGAENFSTSPVEVEPGVTSGASGEVEQPIFPDPDLAERGPSAGSETDPGQDTSFEG